MIPRSATSLITAAVLVAAVAAEANVTHHDLDVRLDPADCHVFLCGNPGMVEAAAEQISQFPEVTYLFMSSGGFDLFVEVYCRDRQHFVTFLNRKLQQVPGVERTETFMILKMFKLSYRWGQAEAPQSVPKP